MAAGGQLLLADPQADPAVDQYLRCPPGILMAVAADAPNVPKYIRIGLVARALKIAFYIL